jgi:hypothetical protein
MRDAGRAEARGSGAGDGAGSQYVGGRAPARAGACPGVHKWRRWAFRCRTVELPRLRLWRIFYPLMMAQ